MKKLLSLLVLAFYAMNGNAQLIVDSLGRVGIGTETPKSFLSVGSSGSDDAALSCSGLGDKLYGIKVINTLRNSNTICGGYFNLKNYDGHCYGGRNIALGVNDMNITQQLEFTERKVLPHHLIKISQAYTVLIQKRGPHLRLVQQTTPECMQAISMA